MNQYDAIVIGAGLGGLSCAARLSALGYRTAVFESHTLPGGFATEFTRRATLLMSPCMVSVDSRKAASVGC